MYYIGVLLEVLLLYTLLIIKTNLLLCPTLMLTLYLTVTIYELINIGFLRQIALTSGTNFHFSLHCNFRYTNLST